MSEIHVRDIGTVFKVRIIDESTDAAIDISDATTKEIKFKNPNGTSATQTATFTTDGTDGYIEYTTVANDLDLHGSWQLQGFVSSATYQNNSEITRFEVEKNI